MASAGYGMYGYNVLNTNGETSDLPVATLIETSAQGFGNVVYFSIPQDLYGMAIPNQGSGTGTWSALRAPVSGLYEIDITLPLNNTAASSLIRLDVWVDKGTTFAANGLFNYGTTPGAYILAQQTLVTLASATNQSWMTFRRRFFLEKDSCVSMFTAALFGTVNVVGANAYASFTLRCLDANNYEKAYYQT